MVMPTLLVLALVLAFLAGGAAATWAWLLLVLAQARRTSGGAQ